jgi:hypothetical protein
MSFQTTFSAKNFVRLTTAGAFLLVLCQAWAQPALVSSVPPNGASGIPTNTSVVFTFNTSMDSGVSSATFYYGANTIVPVTSSWSAGNTVLTCTPVAGFPPSTNIMWSVIGLSTHNELITPTPTGRFTTAAGGTNSLSLSNPRSSGGMFSFTVLTASNQTVVVEYKTNLTAATWQQLLTTNSPGNQFSVSTSTGSNQSMFFRARTGP